MEYVLVIIAVVLIASAVKGYKAERHARKVVFHQDLSFIDYICAGHPIMATCGIIFILVIIIAMF